MTDEKNEQRTINNESEIGKDVVLQDTKDLKEKSTKKKKKIFFKKCEKCDEYKSGWARAQADYQNLVKETEKNRSEWAQYSERQILEEFIPIYSNFKQAFATYDTDDADVYADPSISLRTGFADNADLKKWKNWKKGIEYIMKQFNKVLEDHGVIEIRTVGETFDPERHEAVSEEESDEDSGKILREVVAGYEMKGKVIRVAKVVVAK